MSYAPDKPDGTNATATTPVSADGRVEAGVMHEIPAREGRAVRLSAGDLLRVVNPSGRQVCDFFAVMEGSPAEHLSMEHVHTALGGVFIKPGDTLVTNRRRGVLRFVEDSSPGVHDTVVAACDHTRYQELGYDGYHDNCADNYRTALAAIGLRAHHVPAPLNLWMNVPLDRSGRFNWTAPVAAPGDHVLFEVLEACIAVMSACPQDMTAVNGDDPVLGPLSFMRQEA